MPGIIEEIRERWIALGLSTRPIDRPLAEKLLNQAYRASGLVIPRTILWMPSPPAALLAVGALEADGNGLLVTDGIRHRIHNHVFHDTLVSFPDRFIRRIGKGFEENPLSGVRAQVITRVREQIVGQFSEQLRHGYNNPASSLRFFLGETGYENFVKAIREAIPHFDSSELRAAQNAQKWISMLRHCIWGWSDDYWLASVEASIRQSSVPPPSAALNRFLPLIQVKENVPIFFPFADVVVCSDNPLVLARDERNRLHSAEGPALAYRDGWSVWAWHGIRVGRKAIENPGTISIQDIETEPNAEVRRVLIERMTWERYIRQACLKPIHSDDWGTLYRQDLWGDPEALMLVKVTNSTPEPDGSYKDYVLRVHPELRPLLENNVLGNPQKLTALNAIASTFGLTGDEYKKVQVQS